MQALDELDRELTRRMFDVNVLVPFLCCKVAIRRMANCHSGQDGAIVNISSASSKYGGVGSYINFAASKAALVTLTTAVAKEQAKEGIRFNCVRPGFVMTDGNHQWLEDYPGWAESVIERTPMSEVGELECVTTATL